MTRSDDVCQHNGFVTYRNDANSMGFISTSSFTITEHREKKNEDNVASKMPKSGHA